MYLSFNTEKPRHKVFISFYHKDDQLYKETLDVIWGEKIINKSVMDGEYNPDDSDTYIKRLIREEKISDTSVIVVLIGNHKKNRKHVDWEIYAGLRASINGSAGLLGILLPEINTNGNEYPFSVLPPRLADNVKTGYAKIYKWNDAIKNFPQIVEEAFMNRINLRKCIKNDRVQMKNNR